ncbi:hypothetical protein BDF19DRAFT_436509 [Syncephalis fuscata]|nr:hypothetical protein BDF19DRAFT_436509 [Syncephalis fuscata]
MSTPKSSTDSTKQTHSNRKGGLNRVATGSVTASTSKENNRANTFGGRSNVRATDKNRRPAFKATLDAPYNIYWPSMQVVDQETLINRLCFSVATIGEYHTKQQIYRKTNQHALNPQKSYAYKQRLNSNEIPLLDIKTTSANTNTILPPTPGERPDTLNHLCIGLASVTRVLEREARRRSRNGLSFTTTTTTTQNEMTDTIMSDEDNDKARLATVLPFTDRPLRLIVVCRADMSPAHMYAHLPMLAYRAGRVPVAVLPAGSEQRLATALNIRRVAVIADWAVNQIRIPAMPWLDIRLPDTEENKQAMNSYVPTRIKRLHTTMPIRQKKDVKS